MNERAGAIRGYWREELALIAFLLVFFISIVGFAYELPFDARLFPTIIGSAGVLLVVAIAVDEIRRRRSGAAVRLASNDPAVSADWPRFMTALLAAPVFGLVFSLFGFIVASLAAMLLMPRLMGYRNRPRLLLIAFLTVGILALVAPYLLNVPLPHGLIGDWLVEKIGLRAS
ncbi:MAG: tripartite tricarboxylate transporter TctB family protein [Xanthobacteraceae bacterium]